MSVLIYDCGSVENTVTAILDTESGAMIIRGNGDIDNYADESSPWYSEHSNITQVTVDKGITRVGSGTFYGCENLSFVEIANTVTSMGADVFQNCTSLTSIKIPKSITEIGNGTFTDSGLTEVKFYGNPPTVGNDIFDGVTADVYTPEGNEEWTETAKGTVAGNGSNLTWKTFDSKPNLIEYDELDYLWSKIKKYVDNNVSVTPVLTSGTKIATITVNGVDTDLYSSPFSGSAGNKFKPIYIDNGVPTECDDLKYPDGEILNLNAKGLTTSSIAEVNGVIDSSGYDNHGQAFGGVTVVKNDELGDCFYFNSTTQLQYLDFNRSFDFRKPFTICFTTKGDYANRPAFFECRTNDEPYRNFFISTNNVRSTGGNNMPFRFRTSSHQFWSNISLAPNVTYRIVISCDSETLKMYVNGVLDSEHDISGLDFLDTSSRIVVGALPEFDSGRNLNGVLTDFRIYQRVLSASEIKTLYILGSKSTYAGVAYSAGTATTATNANNVKLTTQSNSSSDMPLVFGSTFTNNNGNQALHICAPTTSAGDSPLRCKAYLGTASTEGQASIMLGNNIPSGSANNARGYLYLYGANSSRLLFMTSTTVNKTIIFNATGTTQRTYTFPDATGTLALTSSDITGNAATATKATQDGSGNTITSTYATIAKTYDDTTNTTYRGMRGKDGSNSAWVRTTTTGIIPYQAGNAGSGHCSLGTSTWYFASAYIDNIYGKLNGNCTGSSSSCTGNAATATTATNATKIKSTTEANANWYSILGVLNTATSATNNDTYRAVGTNIAFCNDANAATAYSRMSLGNSTASTSSASAARAGLLCLYGTNKGYANLIGPNITGGINVYMPSIGGYIPVSSDNTVRNIVKVSALPSSPNANTMYLVTS